MARQGQSLQRRPVGRRHLCRPRTPAFWRLRSSPRPGRCRGHGSRAAPVRCCAGRNRSPGRGQMRQGRAPASRPGNRSLAAFVLRSARGVGERVSRLRRNPSRFSFRQPSHPVVRARPHPRWGDTDCVFVTRYRARPTSAGPGVRGRREPRREWPHQRRRRHWPSLRPNRARCRRHHRRRAGGRYRRFL